MQKKLININKWIFNNFKSKVKVSENKKERENKFVENNKFSNQRESDKISTWDQLNVRHPLFEKCFEM